MILCFLYGGFSLIAFLTAGYTNFWRSEIMESPLLPREFLTRNGADSNGLPSFPADTNFVPFGGAGLPSRDPLAIFSSPISIIFLFGGIISILAGIGIWHLMREKEIKKIREETANHLLLPEERKVLDAIKNSNMESTQSRLTSETGLNRVQIHRIINRLEAKGILEKHKYGLTNKIILKKEIFE